MNFLTETVSGFFALGGIETSFIWELTRSRCIGALSSIMFSGRKLRKVVLRKKDVVLFTRSRIQGMQVFVGASKGG